jgi:hypothetical protein
LTHQALAGWMAVLADHGTASLSNEKWEDSLSDDFGEQWILQRKKRAFALPESA